MGRRGREIDSSRWPPTGPKRQLLEQLDRLHRQAGFPSLQAISDHEQMHLKNRTHISRRLRGTEPLTDEPQVREFVRALHGTTEDEERAVRTWRRIGLEDKKTPPVHLDRVVPRQLPGSTPDFVGRGAVFTELDQAADQHATTIVICAVDGMAGVGKTTTANQWAHSAVDRFPDGQLYINLRGFDEAGEPVGAFEALAELLAPYVRGKAIPSTLEGRAAEFRTHLADTRTLLFLDNARSAEQVRPLLPGSPGCLTMITSRNRLTGLIITEGAHALPLDLMTEKEAHDLLLKKLGTARAERDLDAVDDLVQICARLPLALSIVGATARRSKQSLRATADELKQRLVRHDLEAFDTGDPRTNLRTVFSWSYELLPTTTARAFRLLALNPAPDFSAAAAASMMKITLAAARKLILELLNNNLLEEPLASRYRFHDLVRAYAQGLAAELDDEVDVTEAQARLLDFYLRSAHGAVLQMYPLATPITLEAPEDGVLPERPEGYTASLAWFDQEREALPRLVTLAAAQSRPGHAWRLAWTYQDYFRRRGYWREWAATQRAALAAAEAAHDAVGVARSKDGLGRALGWLSEFEEAARQLSLALGAFKALNDLEGQAHVHIDLGTVYELQGYFDLALEQAEESLKIARRTSNRSALAKALNNTGWYYAQLGNPEQALSHCLEALELHRRLQNKRGEFNTLDSIGYAYLNLGDYHAARQHFQQALALHTHIGDRWAHAQTLMHLGDVEEADGNLADAIPKWRDALEIFEQLQHSDAAVARARLARYGPAAAAAPDGN